MPLLLFTIWTNTIQNLINHFCKLTITAFPTHGFYEIFLLWTFSRKRDRIKMVGFILKVLGCNVCETLHPFLSSVCLLLTCFKYIILLVSCQVKFFMILECPNSVILSNSSFIFLTFIIISQYRLKSSIIFNLFYDNIFVLELLFSTGIFQLLKKILFNSTEKMGNTVAERMFGGGKNWNWIYVFQ